MNLIMKKYERLTKYIDEFACGNSFGEMVIDTKHKGTKDDPKHFPYVKYEKSIHYFLHDFYEGDYAIKDYLDNGNEICKSIKSGRNINDLSEKELLIYLTWIIRGDRFYDGLLLARCKDGTVYEILKGLKAYDDES